MGVPTAATLDALYASLNPTIGQLSSIWPRAEMAWAPASTKSAWLGALTQASQKLQDLSIEGQLGQQLAMGAITPQAWKGIAEAQADLIDYVGREVDSASYTVSRLWREVIVQTASDAIDQGGEALKKGVAWAPYVAGGVLLLLILTRR